ncbi:11146_t:CDS:2 [Funneliformis geosporum]|uniref:11146_t:CDS:1 n=1 Tax=Funneliformis geosporum TaxID=1117311 RepID=A0A9W4SF94_9GLOM|nr:11146_t:CDS:2 [Funneliformis geosporum]
MVIKNNIEKTLKDLETRIMDLEKNNEGLRLQFEYLEEKVRDQEEETKAKQETINHLEEKFREREEFNQEIINKLEGRISYPEIGEVFIGKLPKNKIILTKNTDEDD